MDSDDEVLDPLKCPSHGFYVAERVEQLKAEAPVEAPLSHIAAFKQANTEWLAATRGAAAAAGQTPDGGGGVGAEADFYDPTLDDEDDAWLQRQRDQRATERAAAAGGGGETPASSSSESESSSALLTCPSCFGTLCTMCHPGSDGVSWLAPFAQDVVVCTSERVLTAAAALSSRAAQPALDGWFYVKGGEEHGPFGVEAMRQWAAQGYFDAALPVRCGPAGELHPFGDSLCARLAEEVPAEVDDGASGAELVPTLRVRCAGCQVAVGVVDTALEVYLFQDVLPSFA